MKYLLVFLSLLYQTIAWAETTTSYDFSNRTPGVNIYAYEGISGSQLPANNSFPSSQYSASSYSDIATNNNSYHDYINYSKNQYPSIRYVVKIDEDANAINKLNIFWNGYGVNSKRNQTDGVRIYIWNHSSNGYDFVTQNTNDWVVELDQDITANITNYVDNNSQITVYVVSQKKTFNRESNWIGTDYFRLSVTHDDIPVPATAIVNYQFDECSYSGSGNEVIDQFGSYSGTSHNSVNTSFDAQIEKALDVSLAQHHAQVSIPLPTTYSVSTWFKKPSDNSGSRYFVLGAMETGGDLLLLDRNLNMRWAVYTPSQGNVYGTYSFANLDANWHHMALVYQGNKTSLYIDGNFIESVNLAPSGTLKYIATSFDGVTGSNPQGFRAPLDEFIVFDGALTSTEITTIYTNQNGGKNYDGSTRDAVSCISAIANYQFDECAYTGNGNEVIDQLGNYSGTSHNSVNTSFDAQIEKALGISSAQQHVQVNIPLPATYSVSTWFKKPTDNSGNRYFILGAMASGGDLLYVDRNNGWRWGIYDATAGTSIDGNYSFSNLDNSWHHMALVYQNSQTKLYINGSFIETINLAPSGTLKYIGTSFDDINTSTPQGFRAPLDEFIVFEGALSVADIGTIYSNQNLSKNYDGSTRQPSGCAQIHHYEIVHDGNGLTCAAEPIAIKACANSECSSLSTEPVSLDFQVNGVTKAPVTFTGSTDLNNPSFSFNHTTAETVTLSITNATVNASNAFECSGVGSSCDMTFADAGYLLTLDDHNSCTTPNLVIQAVKLSDNGMSCAPAYVGEQPIDLTFIYSNPVTGTKLPKVDDIEMAASGVPQRRTVNFDTNAKAELPFQYNDAGQIRVEVGDASTLNLAQGSVTTTVTPAKLIVRATESNSSCLSADPDDLSCTKFKKAGENFNIEISATCDDTSIRTSNFKLDNIALTHQLIAPENKNLGQLAVMNANISNNGFTKITDQSISEVGVFTITATPPERGYFGKTITSAVSENIGRFIPDHFTVTPIFDGELVNSNGNSFVYTGEMTTPSLTDGAIGYKNLMEPEILISAKNSADITTRNYTGNFMRLIDASFTIVSPVSDSVTFGQDNANKTDLLSDIHVLNSNLSDQLDGTIKYKFSNTDNFVYIRNENSLVDKYSADIDLQITSIIDKDDVVTNDTDSDDSNGILTLNPNGIDIRFGRWNIENTYGPETSDLPLPMSVQYWDGSQFVTNVLDSLTAYDGSIAANYTKDNAGLSPQLAIGVVNVSDAGPSFSSGLGQLLLSKPSDGSQGQIRIIYNDVPSWLKFNWDTVDDGNDGNIFDDNPSGIATFGLYRGNDRIISWREVTN